MGVKTQNKLKPKRTACDIEAIKKHVRTGEILFL
jgi:hypothetical protein